MTRYQRQRGLETGLIGISYRRWSFYVLLIWAFIQWMLVCLFIPETYHPVLLRNKARKLRKESGDERWWAPIEKLNRSIPLVQYLAYGHLSYILTLTADSPPIHISAFSSSHPRADVSQPLSVLRSVSRNPVSIFRSLHHCFPQQSRF